MSNNIFREGLEMLKGRVSRHISEDKTADDYEEEFEEEIKHTQWSSSNNINFFPCAKTKKKLPPGFYNIIKIDGVLGLHRFPVKTDNLLKFSNSVFDQIVKEIKKFWDREDIFRQYGLVYKRGILLYGDPGNGKSCIIQLLSEDVINRGGIVLKFSSPGATSEMLKTIREIQPDIPVVVLMEDIDSILEDFCESDVLNILDGVDRIDKAVFVATTNYPERLGERVINRPSRFDKRFEVKSPTEKMRREFFEHLIQNNDQENIDLDYWVEQTENMSFAHMKELFVASIILGDDFDESLEVLNEMMETELDSKRGYEDREAGFSAIGDNNRSIKKKLKRLSQKEDLD